MLRSLEEQFGIGMYNRYILDSLLALDSGHTFVLYYADEKRLGERAHNTSVEEHAVKAPHKILWDQWAIPRAAKAHGIDVLFHTKFTVPLYAPCKTVMVLHGSSWFFHPEFYSWFDIKYVRHSMPRYCKRADAIIANSELTKQDFIDVLGIPDEKIFTISFGLAPGFQRVEDQALLDDVRRKYRLPERFVLTVGRYTPRKNFDTAVRALAHCKIPDIHLVAAGAFEGVELQQLVETSGVADRLWFPGYIEQQDLPAVYSLASAYIFPSVYEELGLPLIEAMACGCPVVASNVAAIPEITAGCALLADPFDAEEMARSLDRLHADEEFRSDLIARGLQHVGRFSYRRAAQRTLEVLETVYRA